MARDTQIESWIRIKPTLGASQKRVLDVISVRRGAAGFEIAQVLHQPLHSISGRITELTQAGFIKDSGRRAWNAQTRRKVVIWEAVG